MKPNVEISSLSVNKLRNPVYDFIKYDIELALDEVDNSDLGIKLKYRFVLLSNPTNIKIIIEGLASLSGQESETAKQLEPDERNIPIVVNTIYQEIFPFLYMVSKSMQIPCPAYKLSQISSTPQPDILQESNQEQSEKVTDVSNLSTTDDNPEKVTDVSNLSSTDDNPEKVVPSESPPQDIVQEANVSSV